MPIPGHAYLEGILCGGGKEAGSLRPSSNLACALAGCGWPGVARLSPSSIPLAKIPISMYMTAFGDCDPDLTPGGGGKTGGRVKAPSGGRQPATPSGADLRRRRGGIRQPMPGGW